MGPVPTTERAKGAPALAEFDSPESVESLTEALADPDLDVRAAAGLALAGLRDPATGMAAGSGMPTPRSRG